MNKIICLFAMLLILVGAYASGTSASNVYARVQEVYADSDESPQELFYGVKCGGFMQEHCTETFKSFCLFVSNNCEEITQDWMSYETNEMARFTIQSAVGFTGMANQLCFAEGILSLREANPGFISDETMEMVWSPDGPADAEHYLSLNYDCPGVSNLISRMITIASEIGRTGVVSRLERDLSGVSKTIYLGLKAAGAL